MPNLGRLFGLFLLCLFLAKTSAISVFATVQKPDTIQLLAAEIEDNEEESDTEFEDVTDEYISDIQVFRLNHSLPIRYLNLITIYNFNVYPSEYLEKAFRPPCN
jgi:hypothetical protein